MYWSFFVYKEKWCTSSCAYAIHHYHHHLSLNREGRWWFCNQFPPFFPVLHCPLGLGEFQAYPFPDVVFPRLTLSALSSCMHRSPVTLLLYILRRSKMAKDLRKPGRSGSIEKAPRSSAVPFGSYIVAWLILCLWFDIVRSSDESTKFTFFKCLVSIASDFEIIANISL